MGVHIYIENKDGTKHPDWDSIRMGDDRENARLLANDSTSWHSGNSFWEDDRFLLRPTETTKFVGERGREMAEILKDPEWWVCLSY